MSEHDYVRAAFDTICDEAQTATGCFVSLYVTVPFYGGPEEGGWWGHDTYVVASQEFIDMHAADGAKEKAEKLAKELSEESRKDFGNQCLREMAWLEARGLESDYLPEPDGDSRYWVCTEDQRGSHESRGDRYYS